jgi:hypothetical protein
MMLRGIFPFVALVSTGFLTACQTPPTALPPSADEATSSTTAPTDKKLDDASAAFKRTEYAAAAEIWRPLAEQGNPAAEVGMGKLYDFGWGVPQDRVQATSWYQKAADQGFAEGECTIGLGYVEGGRVQPHDVSLGLALMKKAVDHGSGSCAESIGELYRVGLFGVSKDPVEAAAWHRRGAEMGDTLAEGRLGIDYQFGIGVERDSCWPHTGIGNRLSKCVRMPSGATLSRNGASERRTHGQPQDCPEIELQPCIGVGKRRNRQAA